MHILVSHLVSTLLLFAYRVKDLLQDFLRDNLGSRSDMPGHDEGFSFKDTAAQLANDLIESLVIDVSVQLDIAFGLDLNPMFNEYAFGFPSPFIQINHFDLNGLLGINEWTSTIDFTEDLQFAVAEAVALVNISASTSPSSIRITSPSELASLVNPLTDNNDQIVFEASLEVVFPVFLIYDGIGLGVRVEYM